jgi:hypothetical protein
MARTIRAETQVKEQVDAIFMWLGLVRFHGTFIGFIISGMDAIGVKHA